MLLFKNLLLRYFAAQVSRLRDSAGGKRLVPSRIELLRCHADLCAPVILDLGLRASFRGCHGPAAREQKRSLVR